MQTSPESKFTRGPWSAEEGQGKHINQIVITAPGMDARSPLARVSNITEDAWPDAHLMKAAPCMYEALKPLEERLPNMPDPDVVPEDTCIEIELTWRDWSRIRSALARAENKES